MTSPRPSIVVDLDAIRHNVGTIRALVAPAEVMVVVKADGYGHGMVECGRAARQAGATWLGVATPDEAVALRDAGDEGLILCWLAPPGYDYRALRERGITPTAYDVEQRAAVAAAGPGDVQLKVDTGLSRGGATRDHWAELFAVDDGLTVTGIWSHLACSDEPGHPSNDAQQAAYEEALAAAERAGIDHVTRHLANSAAALTRPQARYDLVRIGLAAYGLDPAPDVPHGTDLRPAMTASAPLALVKRIPQGAGVSYGHSWIADRDTTVGLMPVGYGDGVPRAASNRAQAQVGDHRAPIRGRVCMDQFVVEVDTAAKGDTATLFGPGVHGEPTAQHWAEWCDTISYEIVTRIGGRFVRSYVGERS